MNNHLKNEAPNAHLCLEKEEAKDVKEAREAVLFSLTRL